MEELDITNALEIMRLLSVEELKEVTDYARHKIDMRSIQDCDSVVCAKHAASCFD